MPASDKGAENELAQRGVGNEGASFRSVYGYNRLG
jgi:hypothetical protein